MKVKIDKPKSYIRDMTISVPYESLEKEKMNLANNYKRSAVVPGFRKGKAPISVILNKFNKEIEKEAKDTVIKNAFIKALKDSNLNPITFANIENITIQKDEGNITFHVRFQVIPDFKLTLNGIKVTYKPGKTDDSEINKMISDIQSKYTTLKPASRPSKIGDSVEIDYIILDNDGNQIDTAQGMTIDYRNSTDKNSIYHLLREVNPGDRVKGEITYPKEFPVIEHHGKPFSILMTINEVKEKVIPEVDDDFAKVLGLNSLKDLKESISNQLSLENELREKNKGQRKLINNLFEKNKFEVPDALIEYYYRKQKEEVSNEEYKEDELRKEAEQRARLNILLDKIADSEEIVVSNEEIEKIIEQEAVQESANKEQLRMYLERTGKLDDVVVLMKREKAFEFLQVRYLVKE